MNRAARIGVLAASVAIFCYAGIGHVLGRTPDDKAYKSLTVSGEVLQKIQSDYVDEPNMRLVTAGSLHGLLESLDSQSSYLTPREYTEYKQKAQSTGTGETGLNLSKRFGYIIVISVLPESPAEKAGIRSGDSFESVAGFTTRDMSVGQALNLLNGPVGSGVKVGVIRRGRAQPEEVDVVRQKLAVPKITAQKTDPDFLALRVPSLDAGRADEIRNRLADAEKQGIHKVILDLRECGRGPVSEAVNVAPLFIPSGTIATLRGQPLSEGGVIYEHVGGRALQEAGVGLGGVVAAGAENASDATNAGWPPAKGAPPGPRPLPPEDRVSNRPRGCQKAPGKKAVYPP